MRKILVPYDGSHSAIRAVEYVASRADDWREVHLLNVQAPIMVGEVSSHYLPVDAMLEAYQAAGDKMLAPVQAVFTGLGINHAVHVLIGHPAETIARYAAENGCDGIVMGSRGGSAIKNLVLGSTALNVIKRAKIPVTLVTRTSGPFAEIPALSKFADSSEGPFEPILQQSDELKQSGFPERRADLPSMLKV
jgi:nucleotide-binding universal stress UspA family protein